RLDHRTRCLDPQADILQNGRHGPMHAPARLLVLGIAFGWACADPATSPRTIDASLTAEGALAGQLLAFASTRDQDAFQVFVVQENGLRARQLTTAPNYNARPNWSHDGRHITFTSCRPTDASCEVYVMNADGSNPANLTNHPANDGFPAWSPRGDRIAFRSERDGNGEIYVMNVDGSQPTRLTNTADDEYYPAWSPTGNRIAFVSARDGNNEIYVMKPDGTLQTRVTSNAAWDADPAWAITVAR